MSEFPGTLYSRSKIWLEDKEGKVIFGAGRLRILKAIQEKGSIHAAAKELRMGYRAVWARIHATEKRLGVRLLEKKIGGSGGGGSVLTPLAEKLINSFTSVQQEIEKETDTGFKKHLENVLDVEIASPGSKDRKPGQTQNY